MVTTHDNCASRAKSTKDKPGTLPISAYARQILLNNPAPLEYLTERIQDERKTDEADEENFVGREESVEKKDEVVQASDQNNVLHSIRSLQSWWREEI